MIEKSNYSPICLYRKAQIGMQVAYNLCFSSKMRGTMIKKITFFAIVLMLTACLSPISTTQKNNYVLNTVPPVNHAVNANSKVLLVSAPQLNAVMNNNNMVYLDGQHQVGYFSENRWAAKPNDMLFSLLLSTLQQQGGFKAVVAAPYSGRSDLRLDVVNFSVIQDFTTKPSVARVKMDVQLTDMKQQTVLKTRAIEANVRATADTPQAGVTAANQALAQCLMQIINFVN